MGMELAGVVTEPIQKKARITSKLSRIMEGIKQFEEENMYLPNYSELFVRVRTAGKFETFCRQVEKLIDMGFVRYDNDMLTLLAEKNENGEWHRP